MKKSFLVICKILGLFVNPLAADEKYSFFNRGNLLQHFQMQLSEKRKYILIFFYFVNLYSILKIFKKRMTIIADVFLNLRTLKDMVRSVSKKSRFREPFDKLHRHWLKHCSKDNKSRITIFIDPCEGDSGLKNVSDLHVES